MNPAGTLCRYKQLAAIEASLIGSPFSGTPKELVSGKI
jgi:hypothetical protein